MFQGKQIYFAHDYSPDLQIKRGQVRQVIKQLKGKGIRAKCPYPAQLRMNTDSGEYTLVEADFHTKRSWNQRPNR